MKIALMQPYFFPYIGYFQLMNAVDEFVIYDNIKFSKKGWINRNRILVNNADSYITLPLKKDSDFLDVRDRCLSDTWPLERRKMSNRIIESYRKAPQFDRAYPVVEQALSSDDRNLFTFILNSLTLVRDFLGIPTSFVISSTVAIDHSLKAEKRVIELCRARKAAVYLNPIGGTELYQKDEFRSQGIDLFFLKSKDFRYTQFNAEFVPWLSIIDVMMFNPIDTIRDFLTSYFDLV